jgi:prepilin-type N-terminal cleavage/methylation domain-containing protein
MNRNDAQNGFGLIEVLAAMALFLVIAAGLAATTTGTIRANALSNRITEAAALVHDKVEQLRSLDPTTNPADLASGSHADPLNPMDSGGARGGLFRRSWTVRANTPVIGVSEVTVTVAWNDARTQSVEGVTYVCQSRECR